jgi:hypothetical protein
VKLEREEQLDPRLDLEGELALLRYTISTLLSVAHIDGIEALSSWKKLRSARVSLEGKETEAHSPSRFSNLEPRSGRLAHQHRVVCICAGIVPLPHPTGAAK